MDTYVQFLEAMHDLAQARREVEHLIHLLAWEQERHGEPLIRIKDRAHLLPLIGVMIESTFRLMKHVQFGDDSNLRQAGELWVQAAQARLTFSPSGL